MADEREKFVITNEDVGVLRIDALQTSAEMLQLEACFYGTLVDRDPASGVRRQGRAKDGWRYGVSRQFTYKGKTYDVLPDLLDDAADGAILRHGSDRTKGLFDTLRAEIGS